MPTFYLRTMKIHLTVIEQIDVYRKHCLLDKGDINRKGGCLVAWETACKAKKDGGLGIIDLKTHNTALLLKYVHKFYNRDSYSCVILTWNNFYSIVVTAPHLKISVGSFWWRDVMYVAGEYFNIASCNLHCDTTVSFWSDYWGLGILQHLFPQLFSFSKRKSPSVAHFWQLDDSSNFHTPLSPVAAQQLEALHVLLDACPLDMSMHDHWTYIWGMEMFTARRAYSQLKGTSNASPVFAWLWKSCSRGRHKFTFWLLLRDRLNTRNILRRNNKVLDDYSFPMCNGGIEETLEHLFFSHPFSSWC
jgi:hypothetical protein